ncbi:MAG TPA: hypothetical protein VGZ22_22225 [Isosphaeraceae bacterium]|nr:hypothetical protein [Isosphaeraceae bacterium]
MNRNQPALCGPDIDWSSDTIRAIGPVLIQVPDLSATRRSSHRFGSSATTTTRRRRRLKREVRFAGAALLLMGMPLGWVFTTSGTAPEPTGVSARLIGIEGVGSPTIASAEDDPRLTLPIEPVVSVPSQARGEDAPVVLPGYVLPDDGSEEPAHAGS